MLRKIGKIALDAVLSLVFLLMMSIIVNALAGTIFGYDERGNADFNGHILLAITVTLTLVFSVWFYKYVSIKKNAK